MIRTDCGKISDTTTKQKLGRGKTLIWGKLENKILVISIDVTRETAVYLGKKRGGDSQYKSLENLKPCDCR